MSARIAIVLVGFSMLGSACISHTHFTHEDTGGSHGSDAGLGGDAFVSDDDAAPSIDAAATDAFVMPVDDAGHDAFVMPVDASRCAAMPTSSPLVIHGTIGGGATYDRPTPACGPLSTLGNAVFYDTRVLCNGGATRSFAFELDSAVTGGIADPFLVVDDGTGDVSTLTCLASDDDGAGVAHDSLATTSVPTGATITVVASDYNNGVTGDYLLTITPL